MENISKLKLEALNRKSVEHFKQSDKTPICIVLDNVRSMHNVGSIFRTADGFSAEKIYLCGITPQPPHREIQKTALGATESVEWTHTPNTLEAITQLKEQDYTIVGIEQVTNSIMLDNYSVDTSTKYALILGNEVDGIDETLIPHIEEFIEIPQTGTKHSFNVSIAGGICIWEYFKAFNK